MYWHFYKNIPGYVNTFRENECLKESLYIGMSLALGEIDLFMKTYPFNEVETAFSHFLKYENILRDCHSNLTSCNFFHNVVIHIAKKYLQHTILLLLVINRIPTSCNWMSFRDDCKLFKVRYNIRLNMYTEVKYKVKLHTYMFSLGYIIIWKNGYYYDEIHFIIFINVISLAIIVFE